MNIFRETITDEFVCEKCGGTTVKESNLMHEFESRYDCEICKAKISCHRNWSGKSVHIPEPMKATTSDRGIHKYAKGLNKSPSKNKHFY